MLNNVFVKQQQQQHREIAKKVKVTMKIRRKNWKELNRIRIGIETEREWKIEREREIGYTGTRLTN